MSLCITTFNRAAYIGQTIESALSQVTDDCEIVILDGGSTDGTEEIISRYAQRFEHFKYIRENLNGGFDRDCDRAVELASGKYCWLLPDDDLLKPGAISAVLDSLRQHPSAVMVNAEVMDFTMSEIIQPRCVGFHSNRIYEPADTDQLVIDLGDYLNYVGCIVIERSIWMTRQREEYYGSLFIYLGVIFQERLPGEVLFLAEPAISYRMGNPHTFSPKMFETFMVNLPTLAWSLRLSDAARSRISRREPWRNLRELMRCRARGYYSLAEYQKWVHPRLHSVWERSGPMFVAMIPGSLLNALFVLYYSVTRQSHKGAWQAKMVLQFLKESPFYFKNWRHPSSRT